MLFYKLRVANKR